MYSTTRLNGLSDGVFSIAMTLLVLTIELPPETTSENLHHALLSLVHDYFAYALSFIVIGMFWSWHHAFVERIRVVTRSIVSINLVFLGLIAFLPFPTSVISDFATTRTSTLFYLGVLAALGLTRLIFIEYVIRSKTYNNDIPSAVVEEQRQDSAIFVTILFGSMCLTFVNIDFALWSLHLLWIVPLFWKRH